MNPQTFAARLRFLREMVSISQRELARISSLSCAHVLFLERGEPGARVEAATVLNLARALGVTMDWLYAGAGDVPRFRQIHQAVERARLT